MMGTDGYTIYSLSTKEFTQVEQAGVDAAMNAFKDKYRSFVDFATIEHMPRTTTTVAEWTRIQTIMAFLVEDVWKRAIISKKRDLLNPEADALEKVGTQLLGSKQLWAKFYAATEDFSEVEQSTVDASFDAFIQQYAVLNDYVIVYRGKKGDILNMPLSTITHSEWNFIVGIMKYKLGNTSFEKRFNG